MKKLLTTFLMSIFLVSCAEEVLTQGTLSTSFTATDLQGFEVNTCSQMHFEKPPVDMLFVVDNSGSSLDKQFILLKKLLFKKNKKNTTCFNYCLNIF